MVGMSPAMAPTGYGSMANITAQMVKELRERTGAGMMDCKGALGETNGEMESAVDLLRKKGLAKAAKKAGRIAADGLIGMSVKATKGVVVEVNSETDFVARNDFFQGLVKMIADVALTAGTDLDTLNKAKIGNRSVADAIQESIAKIGENISLRRSTAIEVKQGAIASYVHNSVSEGLGKIGVLVALESSGKADELAQIGRKIAMHVAASNPQAVEASGLSAEAIRREKEVLADKAKAQGKPANVVEKIVESGLKTFYKEVCLLDQPYIHEPDKSVAQAIKEAEGKAGAPIKVKGFVRYALGEGIEREEKDFAAEVAAAVTPR
jgi:elongation factor Ts